MPWRRRGGEEGSPYCSLDLLPATFTPNTAIRLRGTFTDIGTLDGRLSDLRGTFDGPIWFGGWDENNPAVFDGNDDSGVDESLKFTRPRYLIIHDIVVIRPGVRSSDGDGAHGISIDDGREEEVDLENPAPWDYNAARFVVVRNVHIGETRQRGECLKLAGVNDFAIIDSVFTDCGTYNTTAPSGNGIDMVGAHEGLVLRNTFNGGQAAQAKGGSTNVEIRGNTASFTASDGTRVFRVGGSTNVGFFRPPYVERQREGANIRLVSNVIKGGGDGAVSYSSCVDCLIANNTFIDPEGRHLVRILEETSQEGSTLPLPMDGRGGRFLNNIAYWDPNDTEYEFQNAWPTKSDNDLYTENARAELGASYRIDHSLWFAPGVAEQPALRFADPDPAPPHGLVHGPSLIQSDPEFVCVAADDYRINPQSPAAETGTYLDELTFDCKGDCYQPTPSLGAFQVLTAAEACP